MSPLTVLEKAKLAESLKVWSWRPVKGLHTELRCVGRHRRCALPTYSQTPSGSTVSRLYGNKQKCSSSERFREGASRRSECFVSTQVKWKFLLNKCFCKEPTLHKSNFNQPPL